MDRRADAAGDGGNRNQDHMYPAPEPGVPDPAVWATLAHDGAPTPHPANASKPRRKPRRRLPPEVLTDAEVRGLLDACPDSVTGQRNAALIALLYRAGLRINEALQVRPKDVDGPGGMVRVLFGKRGYARTVGLDAGAMALVSEWLATRHRLGLGERAPLFCSVYGNVLTAAYIRRLLPNLARKAGIFKRVHAHGLRHTHAAQLRSEGVDIVIISKQLGHVSITTTARYLDHIAPLAVVEAMRRRVW
jgi:integrase